MIDVALTYIQDILNEHFKNEFSISENKAVLSNLVKADGAMAEKVDGKIVFFLISLDEESTLKNNRNKSASQSDGSYVQKVPTLHLNMQLVFCANFDSSVYIEGLSYLSSLIRFFQIHRKIEISHRNNSSHNANHLNFELCKLDHAQLSHLWSAIGGKLVPFVQYKVGMLVFDDVPMKEIIPTVNEPLSKT
ncbi:MULTISPECIES: DUF4255 domain-containing protein [unclassified Saccharicrinis]|uniref:DUF4255 domain-containing protein n=1 Tax=unclassified Saccharicrinis TaxID=2646859 RepID=UPI003D357205